MFNALSNALIINWDEAGHGMAVLVIFISPVQKDITWCTNSSFMDTTGNVQQTPGGVHRDAFENFL